MRNNSFIRYLFLSILAITVISSAWDILETLIIIASSIFGIALTIMLFLAPPIWLISVLVKLFRKANEAPKTYKERTRIKNDFVNERKVKKKTETPKKEPAKKEEEVDFIKKFKQLDVIIENEPISDELVKCQKYLETIKNIEKEFPETKENTKKIYSYYLPMLDKILNDYTKVLSSFEQPNELANYELRITETLKLVNGALETISVDLVKKYYDSMNVDIKTLEHLLRKDGLVDDFKEIKTPSN